MRHDRIICSANLVSFAFITVSGLLRACLLFVVFWTFSNSAILASEEKNLQPHRIEIDRKARTMSVYRGHAGKPILETRIGIGRGGLGQKKSMNDYITPCGEFVVDLILYQEKFNDVDKKLLQKYSAAAANTGSSQSSYLASPQGMQRLFSNMNSIDFNGDSKPDTAYGAAYIGLNSRDAITGPKLSEFKGTTYWFSIALHGTADEKRNIGSANSGGCIQIPSKELKRIIEEHMIGIGTSVTIR